MRAAVTFRPAGPGDEPFLYRVFASTREEELAPVPWSPEQKAAFLAMQFRAQHAHYQRYYPAAQFLIVVDAATQVPIGRLYVARDAGFIHVIDIALLPEHRRRGTGTAMLRDLMDEARERAVPVRIFVEQHNPALSLYERLGFRRLALSGIYFEMEWSPDAVS